MEPVGADQKIAFFAPSAVEEQAYAIRYGIDPNRPRAHVNGAARNLLFERC
jgi:hypothetical protein